MKHKALLANKLKDLSPAAVTIGALSHWIGGSRKHSEQWTNGDQKSLETVLLIAICHQSGDKWQSKTVSNDFYLGSSIVLTFSIAAYLVCL